MVFQNRSPSVIHHDGRPQYLPRNGTDHIFDNLHHPVVIGICLIELQECKLRVVPRVNSLVAENAANFVNPVKAADNQAL